MLNVKHTKYFDTVLIVMFFVSIKSKPNATTLFFISDYSHLSSISSAQNVKFKLSFGQEKNKEKCNISETMLKFDHISKVRMHTVCDGV